MFIAVFVPPLQRSDQQSAKTPMMMLLNALSYLTIAFVSGSALVVGCHALAHQTSSSTTSSTWRPLPHVHHMDRRKVLSVTTAAFSGVLLGEESAATNSNNGRSVASVDSNPVIPVWPTWGGGRVVPVSLGGPLHDPFLLLAHHKHWFDPRDPLRGPFKLAGKALGLPYVDVEGFAMHPHRGLDILTYVLDGSDGFQHRDSLGDDTRVYRGGCAQWMRCGAGVLHEEFWETRPDRRTDIELFQLWVNLPAVQKLEEPAIHYIGDTTPNAWIQESSADGGVDVRNIGSTLNSAIAKQTTNSIKVKSRPPVNIMHATIEPGAQWVAPAPPDHSALLYVREGTATLQGGAQTTAKALQTTTFHANGDSITIQNDKNRRNEKLDVLLLTGAPLREPVAWGGPIVMNTQEELQDAYHQLSNGTFLKRNVALKQQELRNSIARDA